MQCEARARDDSDCGAAYESSAAEPMEPSQEWSGRAHQVAKPLAEAPEWIEIARGESLARKRVGEFAGQSEEAEKWDAGAQERRPNHCGDGAQPEP